MHKGDEGRQLSTQQGHINIVHIDYQNKTGNAAKSISTVSPAVQFKGTD